MNKRFSTLLAIALMVGGLSASAQYQPANQAKVTKLEAGRYYHIANGTIGNGAAFLSATKRAGADSIITKTTFTDVSSVDSALWLITKSTQSVTGKDVYTFVNKATNAKLQFKKEGNAIVAPGLDEWTWALDGAGVDSMLVNVTSGVKYTIETTTNAGEVKVLKGSASTASTKGWSAYSPIDIVLTAAQLNDANSTYFKLAFGGDVADNVFTKYKIHATPSNPSNGKVQITGAATDSVFLQLIDAPAVKSNWDAKKMNKNVYLKVDTTFHEIGSATWADAAGFQFKADTLSTKSDVTTVDTVATGENNLASFKFLFLVNKGAVSGDSMIVKVNTPAVKHKVVSDKPANEKATVPAYVSWGFIGNNGTKVLTTSNDNTKLPLISFLQGTKVTDLDVTKAYFIKVVKGQNKDNNGLDYVVPNLTGSATYVKDATSALVPATQWSIAKNAAGNYTFTNREDATETFTTPVYKEGANYAMAVGTTAKDTVTLTPIATEGKYVGYKHFSAEELGNLSVSLQFVTPIGTSAYVYVAKDDSMLRAKNMEEGDAMKFKLEAANKGIAFGADSLESTAYILKEQFGSQRVLGYDDATKLFRLMQTNQTTADSTAVIFRATKNAGEYQIFAVDKTGGTTTPYVFTSTAEAQSTIAGSNASMYAVEVDDQVTGYFKVTTPEAPQYINITKNSTAHMKLSSAANNSLMIGMSEKFEPVLKAASEMDATYSLFIDTANVTNQANPKFYMMTTAGLGDLKAETTDAIQANYLNVNKDGNLEFIVAKQFGASKDTLLVYNHKDLTAAPDTVKMDDNKAMFMFRATPTADEMLIEAAGTNKCLQQINGKLILTDVANALPFTAKSAPAPVGNEDIAAGTIKVVAGEGNVTVYGAAGKKVTVSDVLGKATTIIATSDSQVIPAAQGVVMIAVEGEATVKAIVK